MNAEYERFEGYLPGSNNARWGQSYYYNFYDPTTRVGALVRIGLQENLNEANTWFIVFKDGMPLFTRTNMNLPYTNDRPATGMSIGGMRVEAQVLLKKTRITLSCTDFSADFVWDELAPMEDCIAMSHDKEGSFARELANVHLEGTCRVSGHLVHRGERIDVNGSGFRDISAGPRNWDAVKHYRLAWPVFDNGTAFAGVHGFSTGGQSAYMRMFHDGETWRGVTHIADRQTWAADGISVDAIDWRFTDDRGREFAFTGKPLFRWTFPLDTFVLTEQMMEFRMADGTVGYGLYETGYRLPWTGIDR